MLPMADFWMRLLMRVSFESSHRSLIVYAANAIGLVAILIGAVLVSLPLAEAASNVTVQHTAMPPCMRIVTVNSNPCGAMIYIDGIQVGLTPMSFPMPTGRYTLVLFAPGHRPFAQRILVPDAPMKVEANLVPLD
jgi:hypothetical protein